MKKPLYTRHMSLLIFSYTFQRSDPAFSSWTHLGTYSPNENGTLYPIISVSVGIQMLYNSFYFVSKLKFVKSLFFLNHVSGMNSNHVEHLENFGLVNS